MNYHENFNNWWAATYQGKLNPSLIMEEAFKKSVMELGSINRKL
jgi:hypothetical protein